MILGLYRLGTKQKQTSSRCFCQFGVMICWFVIRLNVEMFSGLRQLDALNVIYCCVFSSFKVVAFFVYLLLLLSEVDSFSSIFKGVQKVFF